MNNEYKTDIVNKFITKSKTLLKDISKPEYKESRQKLLACALLGMTAIICISQSVIMIAGGIEMLRISGIPEYQIQRLAGVFGCLGGAYLFWFGLAFPAKMIQRVFFKKVGDRKGDCEKVK
jgi:hypothetical protein